MVLNAVLCSKWEEEHREALKKKRLASQEKKAASLAAGEKAIAEQNEQRKVRFCLDSCSLLVLFI